MKRLIIEKSKEDIVSQGGLALIAQAIKNFTNLSQSVDRDISLRHGIKHSQVLKSYLGLLCIGKNDFEAINTIESEHFFMTAKINSKPRYPLTGNKVYFSVGKSPCLTHIQDYIFKRRYSKRAIETYLLWIQRYNFFHIKRHTS